MEPERRLSGNAMENIMECLEPERRLSGNAMDPYKWMEPEQRLSGPSVICIGTLLMVPQAGTQDRMVP